jgi:hypothetical protein
LYGTKIPDGAKFKMAGKIPDGEKFLCGTKISDGGKISEGDMVEAHPESFQDYAKPNHRSAISRSGQEIG